jgi:hypothetical protein
VTQSTLEHKFRPPNGLFNMLIYPGAQILQLQL